MSHTPPAADSELRQAIRETLLQIPEASEKFIDPAVEVILGKVAARDRRIALEARIDLVKAYIEISEGERNGSMIGHFRTDLRVYGAEMAALSSTDKQEGADNE